MSVLIWVLLAANVILFACMFLVGPAINNWLWLNGYKPSIQFGGLWDAAKNGFKPLPECHVSRMKRADEMQRQKMAEIYEADERRLAR